MGSFVAGKLLVSPPDRLLSVTFGGGGPLFQPPKKFTDTVEATAASLENGKGIGPLLLALTEESGQKVAPEQADAFSAGFIGGKDQKALAVTDFLKANKE
jgi:hypothetical protein